MAKLMLEEEKHLQSSFNGNAEDRKLGSRNRHWSLNDLTSLKKWDLRESQKKRWMEAFSKIVFTARKRFMYKQGDQGLP